MSVVRKAKGVVETTQYFDDHDALKRFVERSKCRECDLCKNRHKIVVSRGRYELPIVMIGEAPGGDEDKAGEPFVGRAGKKLDTVCMETINLDTNRCIIVNTVKCRPLNNRSPKQDEMAMCFPILRRQIEILAPRIIVLLGGSAVKCVLQGVFVKNVGKYVGLMVADFAEGSEIREPFGRYPTFVINHPAYIIYDKSRTKEYRENLVKLRETCRELGVVWK